MKEAKARIKINQLLTEAGWRFEDNEHGRANVVLEHNTKITKHHTDTWGDDFESAANGFIDFLLLDKNNFPLVVLEAKAEDKNPLIGKEQARAYARAQNCRFIILSNGNSHYLWDLQHSSPRNIVVFPTIESLVSQAEFKPDTKSLINERMENDYIVHTQMPNYQQDPSYRNDFTRAQFIEDNKLQFLRKYQLAAVKSIQQAVSEGKDRFLFEMATGTGKTLVSAAVIKLFLRSGNARRVLFLVDRLELEDQADKALIFSLHNDFHTVIYKENMDDWHHAEIVVSTVQTFLSNNRYKRKFKPEDFDLVISDEAHRSIGGNSRAVFEYFIGYKLGLTATPKDYLKNMDHINQADPREIERRTLLDTYRTFGCESGIPTYRYSLLDGVRDGYLVNPIVVDARTEITTQLLSDKGYSVITPTSEGEDQEEIFGHTDFEKTFFSDNTNAVFCQAFLDHALLDPISGEIGKTIIFCVSQNHASKITQILNQMADKRYPGRYQSDFAVQVTSSVPGAQQFSLNFSGNKLNGYENLIQAYRTSKTRVCVTVGMMTTGYDCTDILNICLLRPIFSPTDFIQIKGRGTRKHDFSRQIADPIWKRNVGEKQKDTFKIFDFFANFEYFEEKYPYDQILELPRYISSHAPKVIREITETSDEYESTSPDNLVTNQETAIGLNGMKIDRMFFDRFEEKIKQDPHVLEKVQLGDWDTVIPYVEKHHLNKPEDYVTLEKLRNALKLDRRASLREILEMIFNLIPYIKSRQELLEEEFDRFDSRFMPNEDLVSSARTVFISYITDPSYRKIVDEKTYSQMNMHPNGYAWKKLTNELKKLIPEYIKDNVSFNKFAL
jgi:type I restriction enzyme R subunit